MSDGVTVDASAPMTFGGDVRTVLESPRAAIRRPRRSRRLAISPAGASRSSRSPSSIESEGIKYVFFQQVSVTGRVMGKGVVASFFPQVAEKGYQLVYGATANLFVDRAGDYIGFGPEESELAAIPDLSTFAQSSLGPRASRVCSVTATTPNQESSSTPTRARTSSALLRSSRRSSASSS